MSIKSQKSLNEECSEIFEKSYSCKSASDESLTDEEEECLPMELLRRMTPAVLSQLRRCFKKSKEKAAALDIDRRVEEVMRSAAAEEGIEFAAREQVDDPLTLDQGGFVAALRNIFGSAKYSAHAVALFRELDPLGTGRVRWRRLLARLVDAGVGRVQRWEPVLDTTLTRLTHCQRESIVKLVSIECDSSFCYAAVSRGGRVGVYGGLLQLLYTYEVFSQKIGVRRRVKNSWITDAEYMSDAQCLVLSSSVRTLSVFDAATPSHSPLHCITGIPDIPTCLAYCPESRPGGGSVLVFGTERGDVTRLSFLRPRVALLPSPHGRGHCCWRELSSSRYSLYCLTSTWRKVHQRAVKRVWCNRDGSIVVSCSHDAAASLRLRHAAGLVDDYVYSVQRGVTCLYVAPALQLVATGSPDGVVRLWGTTGGAAHARLVAAPALAVLDVVVVADALVVAYCGDCSVYIWDLYEEALLQIIKVKFPFLGAIGKKIEFGPYCIHPGPAQQSEDTGDGGAGVSLSAAAGRDGAATEQRRSDLRYGRFNCGEILVSCCDCVCSIPLRRPRAAPLPAPGDTLRARRPSHWDLPADFSCGTSTTLPQTETTSCKLEGPTSATIQPVMLTNPPVSLTLVNHKPPVAPVIFAPYESSSASGSPPDLEELLEKAGLRGILEKDFVLMRGLKHELNRKLQRLAAAAPATRALVALGAPHLALERAPLLALPPPPCRQRLLAVPAPLCRQGPLAVHPPSLVSPLTTAYERICMTFLDTSSITTSTSGVSTPRNSKMFKL